MPAPLDAPAGSSYFKVSERSRCFDGHFEGAPILPGVVHVALALSACVNQAGKPLTLTGLRDFRLRRPLRPGDEVDVVLTGGSDATSIRFEIRCRGESVTVGVLVFNPADDEGRG
jgi:3-hydroxymyristoyl/3-hydroxydecanoyl-(acyl carrier protein) dehydratase